MFASFAIFAILLKLAEPNSSGGQSIEVFDIPECGLNRSSQRLNDSLDAIKKMIEKHEKKPSYSCWAETFVRRVKNLDWNHCSLKPFPKDDKRYPTVKDIAEKLEKYLYAEKGKGRLKVDKFGCSSVGGGEHVSCILVDEKKKASDCVKPDGNSRVEFLQQLVTEGSILDGEAFLEQVKKDLSNELEPSKVQQLKSDIEQLKFVKK